jgi:transposase
VKEPRSKPKIDPYLERIAQIIEEDKVLPKKQRHTTNRIYERLREMGYEGKSTQVKGAVRELLRVKQKVFMLLVHRVGEAQVDFGYALAKVA